MRYGLAWAAVWVIGAASAVAAPPVPAGVEFTPDVTYATAGGEELKLNIARPKDASKGPLPLVVIIHGGGWAAGKRTAHDDLVLNFAARGYVAATISYRFAPKHVWPAQIQDAKAAVRFLRASAEKYGIDKQRVGAIGFSAGAHLSMLLGTMDKADGLDDSGGNDGESSKVSAVVSFVGPTDLTATLPAVTTGIVKGFLGGTPAEKPEAAKRASPVTYVNAADAATLMYAGTKDRLVPTEQAVRMAEALTAAGVPGRVELLLGADHGWGGAEAARTAAGAFAWFEEWLKKAK
ncbi:MAG TPA: alpha/beta hydrolase [Tepidisphaeraceae bacterium]|nr:alpha/beta hydrolase [Tepidisphaeraceae bacterium]